VVAKLKRIHAYDDSLVVVTADHGIAFTKGSLIRGVAKENYPEIMWTPLLVKAPRQERGVADDRASLGVDLLPTIADHLRIKMPWKVDGQSLLGAPRAAATRRVLEWDFNALRPAPGQKYVTVDGPQGFASVLRASASTGTGDPDLRLFAVGGYAGLIGTDPEPLVDRSAAAVTGRIVRHRSRADGDRGDAPWLYVGGKLSGSNAPVRHLAVAVNGKIATTTLTTSNALVPGLSIFSAVLPPEMVHGPNDRIDLYVVEGDESVPRLVPVTVGAPP
jgi:arylsulfatase A-like enzyme